MNEAKTNAFVRPLAAIGVIRVRPVPPEIIVFYRIKDPGLVRVIDKG
jgi:hypothetical protein